MRNDSRSRNRHSQVEFRLECNLGVEDQLTDNQCAVYIFFMLSATWATDFVKV